MTESAEPATSQATRTVGPVGRVLVAGVGNLFLGDDGFGSEVARHLAGRDIPAHVTVTDYGIRSMHLAYDLLDGWDHLLLIDLLPSRGRPGAVHIIEIDPATVDNAAPDPHGMAPHSVLAAVGSLGGELPPTVLIGCEGADVREGIGLSPAVSDAVEPAVAAVLDLLTHDLLTHDLLTNGQLAEHRTGDRLAGATGSGER